MIILFIQLLTICTGEGNKTDHQPMIYDPNKTSALNAEPFKCSAFISVCCQLYCTRIHMLKKIKKKVDIKFSAHDTFLE
jgi:hypothetical protein